jgi:histidinol-phosphatase (PHP family)
MALHRHGVPVTLGSDAHAPTEVGYCFDEARTTLRAVGYERLAWFEGRKMTEVPL